MNFLAHLYLSGNSDELKIGNFIGDYVKGRKYQDYPIMVQQGILIHRQIDSFIDAHPDIKPGKLRLRKKYGRYAGIVTDIFCDHFLAKEWNKYSQQELNSFIKKVHSLLINHHRILPAKVKSFLPYLVVNKRLLSYATISGVKKTLHSMSKYSTLPAASDFAIEILKTYYHDYLTEFHVFFPKIIRFLQEKYEIQGIGE